MDLTRSAMDYIAENSKANTLEFNGQSYTDKAIFHVDSLKANTICVHTLSGFVGMVRAEKEKFALPAIVEVIDPETVCFLSAINDAERSRQEPFRAEASIPNVRLNDYLSVERMLIQLKSQFIESEDRNKLISLFGNITEDDSRATGDDGFSQNVVIKSGISMKQSATVPSVVKLIPYRTFNEVDQPESEFVVRVRKGSMSPEIALIEADGGKWKNNAMNYIKAYLDGAFGAEDNIIVVA